MTSSANNTNVSANCGPGKVAVGGGGNGSGNRVLTGSFPILTGGTPTGWTAEFSTANSENTVYVICAN